MVLLVLELCRNIPFLLFDRPIIFKTFIYNLSPKIINNRCLFVFHGLTPFSVPLLSLYQYCRFKFNRHRQP
uniref:Uncharacterized protein n=1 Tax=uncultured marine virus TaxID=186617 RepID=A0A0F7L4Z8_9VIRU|nr:hypothetical protein [uncultured marine virus]